MSDAISFAEATATLTSNPRPVLCLDTCDFLDVVRSFEEKGNTQSEMVRDLLDVLDDEPDRVQPVITDLVRLEWRQNIEECKRRVADHLRETDLRLARILNTCEHAKVATSQGQTNLSGLPLIQGLVALAEDLMNLALVLEMDSACVERALSRVLDRRRPSHKGEIKDSIHMEHYLELARQLTQASFAQSCIFVSANKADFWAGPPQLHPDLQVEFDAAGLQFFGRLEAALGWLGI